jgi:hypothetical protein
MRTPQPEADPETKRDGDEPPLQRQAATASRVQRRAPVRVQSAPGIIQRHAAFEHYLLGQVPPSQLAALPMVREVRAQEKENEDEISNALMVNTMAAGAMSGVSMEVPARRGLSDEEAQQRENVKHTIMQEMDRLR